MAKVLLLAIVTLTFCVLECNSILPAKDVEILNLSEQLFNNADKRLARKVVFSTKSKPVLKVSEADLNSVETVKTMRPLFDNYKLDSVQAEVVSRQFEVEQDRFLDAVVKTTVMRMLMDFFKKKNVDGIWNVRNATLAQNNFKNLLKTMWFTNYARMKGGLKGSSGFEHVFCKEVIHKNGDNELSGFHNWIYFHDQEMIKNSRLFFQRLARSPMPLLNNFQIVKYRVSYDKMEKVTSMFVGTTPEFEMALYSMCIEMDRTNCVVSLGGKKFTIKTFAFVRGPNKLVASSYPAI